MRIININTIAGWVPLRWTKIAWEYYGKMARRQGQSSGHVTIVSSD